MKKRIYAMSLAVMMLFVTVITSLSGITTARADGGPVIKLHYNREDGKYDGWSVWFWEEGGEGGDYPFEEINGEQVATFDVTPGITSVGFIVRTAEWEKDFDGDQFIDISEMVSGSVDVYVESGVEGFTKEYGADAVTGTKLKTAKYNDDSTITVLMTGDIEGDLAKAFTVSGRSGEIEVKDVKADKKEFTYTVTLAEELNDANSYKIGFDGTDYNVNMPIIYSTDEFEEEYTYDGDDLGATYTKEKTSFRVWAPTAESMKLNLYESGLQTADDLIESIEMKADVNGTWVAEKEGDLNGTYYTYAVTIDAKTVEACDPYARTTGVNGKRAMVIDLSETDPEGWDKDKNPHAGETINDAVIYEAHVRDLTVDEESGIQNKGKFLGLTETGTTTSSGIATGLDHIKDLGATHLHLLPIYDFGSVDETYKYEGLYNWGYDPVNYNVPEGSYSTDPYNGEVRVSELKQTVKALHDNDVSVVMDVVYNHVQSASDFCINKLVPGYFSRINEDGTYSNGSGCGNDTATERSMVKKYIVESVNYWADEYHIDGFRFDLVGLMDTELINEIVETVHENHPDVIFYGEGWSLDTDVTKDGYTLATQQSSEKTPGFSYFNDTIRDGLKGSVFDTGTGFVSGSLDKESTMENCFLGDATWCSSPSQTINYASCHDNNTLYDRLRLSRGDASNADIIKMNNLAAAIYMTAEGTPFLQAGEEMLRTKTNDDGTYNSNSYNSGDGVNAIDWNSLADETYADVYDYYKGLIAFRKAHGALRLTTAEDVAKYVSTVDGLDSKMVGFDIKGGMANESAKEIYIIFNANAEDKEVTIPEGKWKVCVNAEQAGTDAIDTIYGGKTTVAGISTLILVKESGLASLGTPVVVVIVIVAVIVIAAVVILCVKSSKKKKNAKV